MALGDTLAEYLALPTQASVAAEVGAGAGTAAAGGLFSSLGSLAGAAVLPSFINFIANEIAQGKVDRQNSLMANVALQNKGLAAGVPLEAWDVTNYQDVANTPAPEQRYDGTWTWNGQLFGTPTPLAAATPPSATAVAGTPNLTPDSWLGQVVEGFKGGNETLVFNPITGTFEYSSVYPNSSTPTGSYVPVGPTVGGVQPGMTTGSNVLDKLILAGAQAAGIGSPNAATTTVGDIVGGVIKDVGGGAVGAVQAGASGLANVDVVKTPAEQEAEARAAAKAAEEAKTKVIIDWLGTYGAGASDSFIRATMDKNKITPADMAKATGASLSTIQDRYNAALPAELAPNPILTGTDSSSQIALDAAVAKAALIPVATAPTSSTPIASKTTSATPKGSTPIVTTGLLDAAPAIAPVAPVVPAPPAVVPPVVVIDKNKNGVIDAEEPPIPPVIPATPPVVPTTPTPPPSGGGLFSSPTRTSDWLLGDPYKYQRDKFTLLDNLLSYGRY